MLNVANQSWGLTILRVIVGVVFVVHGWQKVFVFGFHGVTAMFGHMGVPAPAIAAPLIALIELIGGAALILGFGTRVASLLLAADMAGAILFVHFKNGFFGPKGFEYPLTLLAACLCLALAGGGASSMEGMVGRRKRG
ncbi:MAG: DoxX family protein [Acidobacteriaceae bacterium]